MLLMDKGIIMIMGTDDVKECHWVNAIEKEIELKEIDYKVFKNAETYQDTKKVVSYGKYYTH